MDRYNVSVVNDNVDFWKVLSSDKATEWEEYNERTKWWCLRRKAAILMIFPISKKTIFFINFLFVIRLLKIATNKILIFSINWRLLNKILSFLQIKTLSFLKYLREFIDRRVTRLLELTRLITRFIKIIFWNKKNCLKCKITQRSGQFGCYYPDGNT